MQPLVSLVASSTLAVHIQLAVHGFVVQFVQDNLIHSLVVLLPSVVNSSLESVAFACS